MIDFASMDRVQLTLMATGLCTMLTMHFTIQLLSQHMFYWKNPKQQKAIIIIILMPTVYSINSFVGLLDYQGSNSFFIFLDSLKECYEALDIAKFIALMMFSLLNLSLRISKIWVSDEAIAKFLALMYSYLNVSISKNVVPDEMKGREIHHSFPMTLFQPRTIRVDQPTLKLMKYFTWQFVIIRPICSILMIVLQIIGIYPSWVSWTFTIVLNLSFYSAMYSLVLFYHVFAKELKPHKPLSKFICIKGIVFFSFWQGVLLEILVAACILKSHHFWLDMEHPQEAIQNVLVCVEMVMFSVLQQYAFHVSPYSGAAETKMQRKKYE